MPRRIFLTRVLTESPAARLHQRVVEGVRTKPRRVPFEKFRRGDYTPRALALAGDATRLLASGEYGAVALFGSVATALALHGAPFDLVSAAARIPADEIRHADLATKMTAAFAGRDAGDVVLEIDRDVLDARCRHAADMEALDRLMLELPTLTESIAAGLLSSCKHNASDPVVRSFYANIVRDEIHHARLGWYYLAWRGPQWSRAERQRAANRVGEIVIDVERRFGRGRDAPSADAADARALGVLDTESQRSAICQLMEGEIVPALDAFGLGASHAWRLRRKPS